MGSRRARVTLHCSYCRCDVVKEVEITNDPIYEKCPRCKTEPMVIGRAMILKNNRTSAD